MAFNPPAINTMAQRKQLSNPMVQIVFLIIVIVLFGWFIVKPKMAQTAQHRRELAVAKEEFATIDNQQRELNRLIAELKQSPEDVAITEEALPLNSRISRLQVLVDSLVRASGMQLAQVNVEKVDELVSAGNKAILQDPYKPNRKLYTNTASVSVTGSIDQFRNFLQLIETNGRLLDVTSMEILGGEGVTQFRIKIKAYAYEAA